MVGRPLLAVVSRADAGRAAESAFRRALAGETVVMSHRFHEFLLPMPSDPAFRGFDRMQQSARIAPLLLRAARRGAVALIQDVTERVAREAELRAAWSAPRARARRRAISWPR